MTKDRPGATPTDDIAKTVKELLLCDDVADLQRPRPSVSSQLSDIDEPRQHNSEIALFDLHDTADLSRAIGARHRAIHGAIQSTLDASADAILAAVTEIQTWIRTEEIVRVVGAGRALLAAAIPANRLAHAGARAYVQNGMIPMPNTIRGGAILAASASGKTPTVLELLKTARLRNPKIRIVGIADARAREFRDLCHVFVGIEGHNDAMPNPLRALADTGEYVISELLDAMVVAAAKRAGKTDEAFREGHEDLGATGPYLPSTAKL
jgi:D-arabinose 5-phosphate isomerase GutQ